MTWQQASVRVASMPRRMRPQAWQSSWGERHEYLHCWVRRALRSLLLLLLLLLLPGRYGRPRRRQLGLTSAQPSGCLCIFGVDGHGGTKVCLGVLPCPGRGASRRGGLARRGGERTDPGSTGLLPQPGAGCPHECSRCA